MAKRRAREVRGEQFRAAQAEEEGPAGEMRKDDARDALQARAAKAAEFKAELVTKDAAQRRAEREERLSAAASRRSLSEARAWLLAGRRNRQAPASFEQSASSHLPPPSDIDDPVLKRARALCSGMQRVAADLDMQNELLRNKIRNLPTAGNRSSAPTPLAQLGPGPNAAAHAARFGAAHSALSAAEEAALVAKAKELLADYKPADASRRHGSSRGTPATSPKATPSGAAARGGSMQASAVLIETTGRRSRLGR